MQSLSSSDTLTIALAGPPETANPSFVGSYMDSTISKGVTADSSIGPTVLGGATPVTILAAPASGTTRHLLSFAMTNTDTAAVVVSIKLNGVTGVRFTLQPGDVLQYGKNSDTFTVTSSTGGSRTSGTMVWGDVTGTLANQGDLQSALDAKANAANAPTVQPPITIDLNDAIFEAASTSAKKTIYTLGSQEKLLAVNVEAREAFAGSGISTATCSIGSATGGNADIYAPSLNVMQTAATRSEGGLFSGRDLVSPDSDLDVVVTFAANSAFGTGAGTNLTAGKVWIRLMTINLQAGT